MSSPTVTLSQRCESAISSLQNLSDDSEFQPQLDATIQTLQKFLSVATDLTTILEDPDAFPGLVIDATNAAENASQASATLFKQISRLDAQNVSQVSSQYWTTLSVFLGAHSRLFAHFIKISSVDDDTQRANLEGPFYAELYQQTRQVADSASQCGDVFLASPSTSQSTLPIHSKEQPADDFDDQLPPSYSERDEATSPLTTPQASSSSGNWFSSALSAVAGSFRAKPEPFVSALCQAVARGDITEARGLLKAGANINGVNEDRDTPLKTAIINGQTEAVEMLIEACADVNCTDGRDLPPLFLAAYLGRLQITKLLLDAGARVDARSISHEQYFSAMFSKENSVAGARLLLNHGADPCSRNISGQFIVATVVSKGRLDMLDMLLQRGAGANATDITGQPLIAMAVRKNDMNMVKLLVKRGANVNAKEISGGFILSRAIQSDNMDMCKLLLDRGAMPDARDSSHLVVLVDCAVKGKLEYVKLLLERGAMSNATNLNGERALITAIGAKIQPEIKVEIVRLLLEHGAWTQARDCSGTNTAMMLARKQGNPELIKTLASFGAKD